MNLQELLAQEIRRKTQGAAGGVAQSAGAQDVSDGQTATANEQIVEPNAKIVDVELDQVILEEQRKYRDIKIGADDLDFLRHNVEQSSSDKRLLLCMKCNLYIHHILNKWSALFQNQNQGGSITADNREVQLGLLQQSRRDLLPLLVQLRKNILPEELLISLSTILYHLQLKQWSLALQSYMKLSIGNVAWPIGVTQIGIHERSAHSKITGQSKIANIMLDEFTRRWITTIKRLITFAERNMRLDSTQQS